MSTRIQLLGTPSIHRDGEERPLRARKPWGLLAYLLLEGRPVRRRDIAGLLFSEADDPAAAFRWALFQIRKALRPDLEIAEDAGVLRIDRRDVLIDVEQILSGSLGAQDLLELSSGELLDGFSFPSAPMFESWLSMQRSRVSSALVDTSRWAATVLMSSDPDSSMQVIHRALAVEPFDDALHELAVATYVERGDRAGASRHIDQVDALYRRELGSPAPSTLRRPLQRQAPARGSPLVSFDIGARSLLRAAEARFGAGDYEGAVSMARRAATQAAETGDLQLEARALVTLAGILIHSVRGRDREAMGLLGRASELGIKLGDHQIVADAEREFGYVAMLEARYGAAETSFGRAIAAAERAGDELGRLRATVYRAMSYSDRCDYDAAEVELTQAASELSQDGQRGALLCYTLSALARVQLRTGRLEEALETSRRAVEIGRAAGSLSILPWALVWEAEAELRLGRSDAARFLFEEAYALGEEFGDPCWEALSMRGLALLDLQDGRDELAKDRLREGVARCRRLPDTYTWAQVLLLSELAERDEADPEDLIAARAFATKAPMPDLMGILQKN